MHIEKSTNNSRCGVDYMTLLLLLLLTTCFLHYIYIHAIFRIFQNIHWPCLMHKDGTTRLVYVCVDFLRLSVAVSRHCIVSNLPPLVVQQLRPGPYREGIVGQPTLAPSVSAQNFHMQSDNQNYHFSRSVLYYTCKGPPFKTEAVLYVLS